MYFFYKYYPYSPKATALSAFGNLGALLGIIGAVASFYGYSKSLLFIPLGIICAAFAGFCFFYVSLRLSKKVAETDSIKNIKTKYNYAYMYCKDHPEMFEEIAAENAAFAARYTKDENGKIVKIKKK